MPHPDDEKIGWKPRPFPWKLLLFSLLMTGAAGAAGYYAWMLRTTNAEQRGALDTCKNTLEPTQGKLTEEIQKRQTCDTALAAAQQTATRRDSEMAQVQGNLTASQEELAALREQRAESEKRLAAFADIQKQFARMVDTGKLQVNVRHGNLVVELPAEVLFAPGVADLSKPGELSVLEVGLILKTLAGRRFLVVGHTDSVPLKSTLYKDNWELSTARALTVTRFLVQAGMKPDAILPAGAGDNDPIASNGSAKERAKNRRIDIVLLPQIAELPQPLAKAEQ